MTPERRDTVLFCCQVGLYVTAMLTLLGILATFWFVLTSTMRTMEENRERDKAMLQQHQDAMHDNARAREQHALAFARTLKNHEDIIERLAR